jgi:two-component system sensor histidine kinase GlrK
MPFPRAQVRDRRGRTLSIFWQLALGSLAIIAVLAGVDVYVLIQLRQLADLNTRLVSDHYPAMEEAKRLLAGLFAQHRSEQTYLALRDAAFLTDFDEETEAFCRGTAALRQRESSPEARALLEEAERLHREYARLFREETDLAGSSLPHWSPDYVHRRDGLIVGITNTLKRYVGLHEDAIAGFAAEAGTRTLDAERATRWLVTLAVALALAAAGSYSILRPLRRLRQHILALGQGSFGGAIELDAPGDLKDLVDTVNWMGHRLQDLDAMKRDFLTNVSHELRTPLASIHEGTHLLLDEIPGSLTPGQREALRIMADSSRRLIQLITNLLDFSKMEAGMMEYRFARTDLRRLVEASIKKVRLLAERRRIPILTRYPAGPVPVRADAACIEQVLDNLLANALTFSPEQAPVEVAIEPDAAGSVVLSVSDAGPGIAPEDLPRIFDRFYRGRGSPEKPEAGSGIGLALAKRAVEAHGGRIWAESLPGHGATLHVRLPLAQAGRP